MKRWCMLFLCLAVVLGLFPISSSPAEAAYDQLPAFPGAEGFGYAAAGGRGGEVYYVTSRELTGPGTFHDGLMTAGSVPRTIVFGISGEITIPQIVVKNKSNITIAGQTAAGDGVTIRGNNIRFINCSDIVIRYVRFRLGKQDFNDDTMYFEDCQNVIIDHSSFSWGTDEVLSIKSKNYDKPLSKNITVQWSIISEGLLTHSMGGLIEMNTISMHHNLYAHNNDRNPKTKGQIDFVNNTVYNWGGYPYVAGGESGTKGYGNVVGNYFIAGLNSADPEYAVVRGNENYSLYLDGNKIDSNKNGMLDGTDTGAGMMEADRPSVLVPERFEYPPVHTQNLEAALEYVLNYAGASLIRDAVDIRVTEEVRNQTGAIIGHENDAGGFPELQSGKGPADRDRDGMPDDWELAHGLNPDDPEDRNEDQNGDGYTNLEQYLNELAAPGFPSEYPMIPPAWSGSPFEPQPPVEPQPEPEPLTAMNGDVIRSARVDDNSGSGSQNAVNWSVQNHLQIGDYVAGDRMTGSSPYTFVTIPEEVQGMEWIRTAVGSRSATSDRLLSFYLTAEADVYVAHDQRISPKPSWLASAYEDTGLTIEDSQPVSFRLYKKHYPAGSSVVMGPNGSTSRMNYFVIIKPSRPDLEPPVQEPSGLTAAAAEGRLVDLQWQAVEDAGVYLVYRQAETESEFNVIGTTQSLHFKDEDAEPGMTYRYRVSAVHAGGESGYSQIAEAALYDESQPPPGSPAELNVSKAGSRSVTLAWSAVEEASLYAVYRSEGEGEAKRIAATLKNNFTDTAVQPSIEYTYRVSALGAGGESDLSPAVTLTTKAPVSQPGTPDGLSSADVTPSSFSIRWEPAAHAEEYAIYRKADGEQGYSRIGTAAEPAFTDRSVSPNQNGYTYEVTAVNEAGESSRSSSLTIAMPVPQPPSELVTGLKGDGFVGLIWTSHGSAVQYDIYREGDGEPVVLAGTAKVDTFYDRSIEPGVVYTYYVTARNASGESAASNQVVVHIKLEHLDEAMARAKDKGRIRNEGIYHSLLVKVERAQQEEGEQRVQALHALENQLSAQSGKHIDARFAEEFLSAIRYLKGL
ncbi:pectinesterase [Paenibacillus lemnae]|uniref:pectinesterase n=1 Tax=Paenibacillus lemnae TaxID=1330551 RepID=UPI001B7D7349|nr:pectinesterase [Paenibacillus lemnae]